MPEIVFGLLIGMWAGSRWGWDGRSTLILGGVIALVLYAASCFLFPYRRCWKCGGEDRVFDSRSNYRRRWIACWWCRGAKDNKRIGARLMGMD